MLACKMGYEYKYPPKIVDLRFERMINNKNCFCRFCCCFCFPVFGQKNQGLYILQFHNAGKDTLFNEAIEGLQNYFLSESDAIIYIAKIPSLLAAKVTLQLRLTVPGMLTAHQPASCYIQAKSLNG